MNFIILDRAEIQLKRIIVFGISGFDRLHKILNDLWVADVTRNQLPTVLQGLAPLRPIVNVGNGCSRSHRHSDEGVSKGWQNCKEYPERRSGFCPYHDE